MYRRANFDNFYKIYEHLNRINEYIKYKYKPYKDEYGNWLTAFSPILNKNNKAEAIIEVDVKFDDFIKEAKSNMLKNLVISLIIFTITTAFLLRYINIVIKFEEKSKKEKPIICNCENISIRYSNTKIIVRRLRKRLWIQEKYLQLRLCNEGTSMQ